MEEKRFRVETFVTVRGSWRREKVREMFTRQGVYNFVKRQPVGNQVFVFQDGLAMFGGFADKVTEEISQQI
jgi:hypothetical protein